MELVPQQKQKENYEPEFKYVFVPVHIIFINNGYERLAFAHSFTGDLDKAVIHLNIADMDYFPVLVCLLNCILIHYHYIGFYIC